MKKLLAIAILLLGCDDPSDDGPLGGAAGSGGKGDLGGAPAESGGSSSGGLGGGGPDHGTGGLGGSAPPSCQSETDCASLKLAQAENCASINCDYRENGQCVLVAVDADDDGFPVECTSKDPRIKVRQYPATGAIDSRKWDCNSMDPMVNPGQWDGPRGTKPNGCDGIDTDCDGIIDNGVIREGFGEGASCTCRAGEKRRCSLVDERPHDFLESFYSQGKLPPGECRLGWTTCGSNKKWDRCTGSVGPTDENCAFLDHDLNCNDIDGIDELENVSEASKVRYACDGDGDGQLAEDPDTALVCDEEPDFPRECERWIEVATAPAKIDCNDSDPKIGEGFAEKCDAIDTDCGQEVSDTFDSDVVLPTGGNHVLGYACLPPDIIMICEAGYASCDGFDDAGIASGCEKDIRTITDCGACGRPCNFACSGQGSVPFSCAEAESFALGRYHTCLTLTDGRVSCWGEGASGQLGNGLAVAQTDPVVALDIGASVPGATLVATGWEHTCAIVETGDVYCWGKSETSQAGTRGTSLVKASKIADSLGQAVALGLGDTHSCAVLQTGAIKCWGDQLEGRLGMGTLSVYPPDHANAGQDRADGLPSPREALIQIEGNSTPFTSADQVAAGYNHTCALQDGTVYCAGANWSYQLGLGSEVPAEEASLFFRPVPDLQGVIQIGSGYELSCALAEGKVYCWGINDVGQQGQPAGDSVASPSEIAGLTDVSEIAVGATFVCALVEGDVYCWGENTQGQLGRETEFDSSEVPVAIPGLHGATAIRAGTNHACALLDEKRVTCWGANVTGQLGRGKIDDLVNFTPAVVLPLGP